MTNILAHKLRLGILLLVCVLGLGYGFVQAFQWLDSTSSGPEIHLRNLPPEGQQTLELIKRGGPFPYKKDGTRFGNREGLLPQQSRNYYKEYTVRTPGLSHRGARRIVAGNGGDYWYTADHYRSFKRIREDDAEAGKSGDQR